MTKANRKRRNKGGRPRIEGVKREPNGRADRAERKVETEKETRAVVIEARARHFGGSEPDCAKEEYGSVLGRLYLAKRIKKHQYEAGNRMAEDFQRYYGLTGIPHPSAKAQDVSRIRGLGGDVAYETARAASNRVMMIEQQLASVDVQGRPVTSVCKRVCVMDDGQGMELTHMVKFLATGLERLADYYGIEKREAA